FQKLEAHATPGGLWVHSTIQGHESSLHLVATAIDRVKTTELLTAGAESVLTTQFPAPNWFEQGERDHVPLPEKGTVSIDGELVSLWRPAVIEEYSASAAGVRQDFVIRERPPGEGQLQLELQLTGARAEAAT